MNLAAMLLAATLAPADVPAEPAREAIRSAVEKGLRRVEQGAANYPKHRNCFSCHHQALPVMALSSARLRGFKVSDEQIKPHIDFSLKSFTKHEAMIKGQSIGGANTTVAYALATLLCVDYTPDASTDALVQFLLARQRSDGAWPAVTKRPPTEGSPFTNAALIFLTLPKYGRSPGLSDELRQRVDKSLAAGKEWLLKNAPESHEDKVFRLRALVHAGVDAGKIATAREGLSADSASLGAKIAGGEAFRRALAEANAKLLEPIMHVEVVVPEEFMGAVVGDLNSRHARIEDLGYRGSKRTVVGKVPLKSLFGYATAVRSATQGRASCAG